MKYILPLCLIILLTESCKKENQINTCIVGKWKNIGAESFGNFISLDSNSYDHYTFYENKNNKGQFSFDYVTRDTSFIIFLSSYIINGNKLELIWPYRTYTEKFEIICNDSIMKLGPPISNNYYEILKRY